MKLLGLKSNMRIADSLFTVEKITKKGVTFNNGKLSMTIKLSEVERELASGKWQVEN